MKEEEQQIQISGRVERIVKNPDGTATMRVVVDTDSGLRKDVVYTS